MRIRFGLFVAFVVCSLSSAASGQQAATPYQEVLKGSVAECDAQRAACLFANTTSAELNKCEQTWRACRSALDPDVLFSVAVSGTTITGVDPVAAAVVSGQVPGSMPYVRPHEVDGCSIPPIGMPLMSVVGGANTSDRNEPFHGQLATGSTVFGKQMGTDDKGTIGPNDDPGNFPCNKHDICYQTCGASKTMCDLQLLSDMIGVCHSAYSDPECPYTGWQVLACPIWYTQWLDELATCDRVAATIEVGVAALGGFSYWQRQFQYCLNLHA